MKPLFYVLMVGALLLTSMANAEKINLYLEPQVNSKVVTSLDLKDGLTIVYTPKNSQWIKVANPANGDVGWVKASDIKGANYSMRFTTSQNGTQQFVSYFGNKDNQYTQQQLKTITEQLEQQERLMNMRMAQMFNSMFYFPQPIFVPVVMVPEQSIQQKPAVNNPVKSAKS